MNNQIDYDYPTLSEMYQTRQQGIDMRELLARTHSTLLGRVQSQLDGLKERMLELEDPAALEFKQVHMRARILGALFAEIQAVIIDSGAADTMLAEHEASKPSNEQGEEL